MDKQFDELSKSLAEGVSRREAVKRFGICLAGVLLAYLGLGSGREARAQGSATCCNYHCTCITGKNYNTKRCNSAGGLCISDFNTPSCFCLLKSSHQTADCSKC